MPADSQVVITGVGMVTPIGIGRTAFTDALYNLRSGIRTIQRYDASATPAPFGGEVLDFDPKAHVRPRKSLKVMSRDIQFGFAAAELALADAKLALSGVEPERKGVVYGADFIYGDLEDLIPTYRQCIVDGQFQYDRWGQAMQEIYPLWMLKYLPNMAACHVAIANDARGHNNSLVLGEVSSLLAVAEGARVIERGAADVMLVGGTSCGRIHPTWLAYRGGELSSRRREEPQRACRPFDAERDGAVHGEGAAAIVLESARHAEARGAEILARLVGFASRGEPVMQPTAPPTGRAVRSSVASALNATELAPSDLGFVSAHGISTVVHDAAEAQSIQATIGNVPVTALKSYFGNLGAATGAVELVATIIALGLGEAPPTLNYERPDPDCPVNVVHGEPIKLAKRTALVLSQTLLGQAAAAVIAAT